MLKAIHKKRMRLSGKDLVFVICNYSLLLIIFVLTLYPMMFVLSASISDPAAVASGKMILFPVGVTFEGYERIMQYTDIWVGYANTIFYTVVGTLLNLVVTLPCAYALSRKDLPGSSIFMGIFIFTMYFSGGLIPGYLNIQSLGLLNTRSVLLVSGLVSVYNLIVCRSFFSSTIPSELHEAARIDGCSDIKMFMRIVLPLSKPIIVVLMLYYGVGHWNSYFNAMIYLKDRELFPLQLFLREILVQSKLASAGLMTAVDAAEMAEMLKQQDVANMIKYGIIVVSTLPMLAIYPWLQKYFAKGVMIGSVKG